MEKIFIGVAWPYANGFLHLGHFAGSLLPPDIFKRYHHLKGNQVLMVSGSDMHGTPITVTADREGVTPEEVATRFHRINKESIEKMNVDFDLFTSTHTDNHFNIVKGFLKELYEKNFILRRSTNEQFCANCNRFLPDRYVEGVCPRCGSDGARGDQCDSCGTTLDPEELKEPRCKICGQTPQTRETEHFYFRLSEFEDRLIQYIADKNHWRDNTKNFTDNWLRDGLKDRPITRDITWGIDVPFEGYENKRIYVWFEAVCGYFTASVEHSKNLGSPDYWKEFWEDPQCRHYYFMGKDNIPFHTIIWPAILMGLGGKNLPYDIPANEYLTLNNEQFSKSRNHAIWLPSYLDRYEVDPLRFYLSITMPENKDTDFTWQDFVRRNNTELVGAMGNFIHRVLTFTQKNFTTIPEPADLDEEDRKMMDAVKEKHLKEGEEIARCKFKSGILEMMELSHMANRYFSAKKPWDTVKDQKDVCATTMSVSISVIKALAVMMYPYIPSSGLKLWKMIGEGDAIPSWDSAVEPPKYGYELKDVEPLFKKMDLKVILEQEASAGKTVEKKPEEKGGKPMVSFEEFQKMDLRVGKIIEVLDHPKADKLYILKVDLGSETRQVVAGLKQHYEKDALLNKQAVFVVNLEPIVLRGEKSDGMILAATDDSGTVSLLLSDRDVNSGANVK